MADLVLGNGQTIADLSLQLYGETGHEIEIIQKNATVSFTGESGVTITSLNDSLTSGGVGSVIKLRKIYINEWILSGDII